MPLGPEGAAQTIQTLGDRIGLFIEGVVIAANRFGKLNIQLADNNDEVRRLAREYRETDNAFMGYVNHVAQQIRQDTSVSFFTMLAQANRIAARETALFAGELNNSIKPADHLSSSLSVLRGQTDAAAAAARRFTEETGTQLFQVQAANKTYRDAGVRLKRLADDEEAAAEAADKLAGSAGGAGSAVNTLADRIEDARGRAVEGIKRMRQGLKDELDATRQEFDDFSVNVSNAITGAIDFAAADSMTKVGANGEEVGMTFLEGLQAQAESPRVRDKDSRTHHGGLESRGDHAGARCGC